MKEKLEQLYCKKVKVITKKGKVIVGVFNIIERKYDNGYDEDSISIEIQEKYREPYYEDILISNIESIELSTE